MFWEATWQDMEVACTTYSPVVGLSALANDIAGLGQLTHKNLARILGTLQMFTLYWQRSLTFACPLQDTRTMMVKFGCSQSLDRVCSLQCTPTSNCPPSRTRRPWLAI